jgi:hypothetical protein
VASEGSGSRDGSGTGGPRLAPSPAERGEFIEYLVDDFSRRRMRVDRPVTGFILNQVVVPEREWTDAFRAGRIDVDWFTAKLERALELGAERAELAGTFVIDVQLAEGVYQELRQRDEECSFPFRIC